MTMVETRTPTGEIGSKAPNFSLIGTDGKTHTLASSAGEKGLVVMFICNHCPYVKAVLDKIIRDTAELKKHGINSIAIMANDPEQYQEDSFENMKRLAEKKEFPFPYVWDKDQSVAKAYGAVCTPDFFGFNKELELQYRGRLDASGMNNLPGAERDLFAAMLEIAETGKGPVTQLPSIGCSIKWKYDN
jgi:peroxiredoxin